MLRPLRFGLICVLVLTISGTILPAAKAGETGESISKPVACMTYVLTPGKLTGSESYFEKKLYREFRFDPHLIYVRPKETITLKFSLRGGYRAPDIFGHDDFEPKEAKDVASGWLPIASGHFLIFPDTSKEHLPRFIPERTKLIAVPLIKSYDGKEANAYDLALGLDRVNKGETESIPFRITPAETDKNAVYLIPTQPLPAGVYYAYSTSDDTEKSAGVIHGFLFAVGSPAPGIGAPHADVSWYKLVCPASRLGEFRFGTKCSGFYSETGLVDIEVRGNESSKQYSYTKDLVHPGVDLAAPEGSELYPIADGIVVDVIDSETDKNFNSLGYMVIVKHNQKSDGRNTFSLYLHMKERPKVEVTDAVEAGKTVLGRVGKTGAAMGSHLHLEVRHFKDRFFPQWGNIYAVGDKFNEAEFTANWIDPEKFLPVSDLANTATAPAQTSPTVTVSSVVDAKLAKEVIDYALLSDAIYYFGTAKYVPVPNWEVINPRACSLTEKQAVFSDPVNGFKAQVYVNGKKLAIVFAGTTEIIDWSTDIAAWFGMPAGQYQDALNFVGGIIELLGPNNEIILTGHSLGGGLAAYVALCYGKKAVVFNAAGLGNGLQSRIPKENLQKQNEYVRCIDLVGDPVTAFGKQMGTKCTLNTPQGFTWRDSDGKPLLGTIEIVAPIAGSTPAFNDSDFTVLKAHHSMGNVIRALQVIATPKLPFSLDK